MVTAANCTAQRRDGSACRAPVLAGEALCWAHSPTMAAARRAARAAGGRGHGKLSRPLASLPPELAAVFAKLRELIDGVERGTIKARDAEVIGGLAGRMLDVAKFAHELGAVRDLEARLDALEEQLGGQHRGAAW